MTSQHWRAGSRRADNPAYTFQWEIRWRRMRKESWWWSEESNFSELVEFWNAHFTQFLKTTTILRLWRHKSRKNSRVLSASHKSNFYPVNFTHNCVALTKNTREYFFRRNNTVKLGSTRVKVLPLIAKKSASFTSISTGSKGTISKLQYYVKTFTNIYYELWVIRIKETLPFS